MKEENYEWLKSQCNHFVNGACHTLSCYKRAGYKQGSDYPQNYEPTCIPKEILTELEKSEKVES